MSRQSEDGKLVVAIESYCTTIEADGRQVDVLVRAGDRLRADDPAVRHPFVLPLNFTSQDEADHRVHHGLFHH
jgi:hypothetical protein